MPLVHRPRRPQPGSATAGPPAAPAHLWWWLWWQWWGLWWQLLRWACCEPGRPQASPAALIGFGEPSGKGLAYQPSRLTRRQIAHLLRLPISYIPASSRPACRANSGQRAVRPQLMKYSDAKTELSHDRRLCSLGACTCALAAHPSHPGAPRLWIRRRGWLPSKYVFGATESLGPVSHLLVALLAWP
jgi:hypothetical protein